MSELDKFATPAQPNILPVPPDTPELPTPAPPIEMFGPDIEAPTNERKPPAPPDLTPQQKAASADFAKQSSHMFAMKTIQDRRQAELAAGLKSQQEAQTLLADPEVGRKLYLGLVAAKTEQEQSALHFLRTQGVRATLPLAPKGSKLISVSFPNPDPLGNFRGKPYITEEAIVGPGEDETTIRNQVQDAAFKRWQGQQGYTLWKGTNAALANIPSLALGGKESWLRAAEETHPGIDFQAQEPLQTWTTEVIGGATSPLINGLVNYTSNLVYRAAGYGTQAIGKPVLQWLKKGLGGDFLDKVPLGTINKLERIVEKSGGTLSLEGTLRVPKLTDPLRAELKQVMDALRAHTGEQGLHLTAVETSKQAPGALLRTVANMPAAAALGSTFGEGSPAEGALVGAGTIPIIEGALAGLSMFGKAVAPLSRLLSGPSHNIPPTVRPTALLHDVPAPRLDKIGFTTPGITDSLQSLADDVHSRAVASGNSDAVTELYMSLEEARKGLIQAQAGGQGITQEIEQQISNDIAQRLKIQQVALPEFQAPTERPTLDSHDPSKPWSHEVEQEQVILAHDAALGHDATVGIINFKNPDRVPTGLGDGVVVYQGANGRLYTLVPSENIKDKFTLLDITRGLDDLGIPEDAGATFTEHPMSPVSYTLEGGQLRLDPTATGDRELQRHALALRYNTDTTGPDGIATLSDAVFLHPPQNEAELEALRGRLKSRMSQLTPPTEQDAIDFLQPYGPAPDGSLPPDWEIRNAQVRLERIHQAEKYIINRLQFELEGPTRVSAGAFVTTPEGLGRVASINPDGTIKVRLQENPNELVQFSHSEVDLHQRTPLPTAEKVSILRQELEQEIATLEAKNSTYIGDITRLKNLKDQLKLAETFELEAKRRERLSIEDVTAPEPEKILPGLGAAGKTPDLTPEQLAQAAQQVKASGGSFTREFGAQAKAAFDTLTTEEKLSYLKGRIVDSTSIPQLSNIHPGGPEATIKGVQKYRTPNYAKDFASTLSADQRKEWLDAWNAQYRRLTEQIFAKGKLAQAAKAAKTPTLTDAEILNLIERDKQDPTFLDSNEFKELLKQATGEGPPDTPWDPRYRRLKNILSKLYPEGEAPTPADQVADWHAFQSHLWDRITSQDARTLAEGQALISDPSLRPFSIIWSPLRTARQGAAGVIAGYQNLKATVKASGTKVMRPSTYWNSKQLSFASNWRDAEVANQFNQDFYQILNRAYQGMLDAERTGPLSKIQDILLAISQRNDLRAGLFNNLESGLDLLKIPNTSTDIQIPVGAGKLFKLLGKKEGLGFVKFNMREATKRMREQFYDPLFKDVVASKTKVLNYRLAIQRGYMKHLTDRMATELSEADAPNIWGTLQTMQAMGKDSTAYSAFQATSKGKTIEEMLRESISKDYPKLSKPQRTLVDLFIDRHKLHTDLSEELINLPNLYEKNYAPHIRMEKILGKELTAHIADAQSDWAHLNPRVRQDILKRRKGGTDPYPDALISALLYADQALKIIHLEPAMYETFPLLPQMSAGEYSQAERLLHTLVGSRPVEQVHLDNLLKDALEKEDQTLLSAFRQLLSKDPLTGVRSLGATAGRTFSNVNQAMFLYLVKGSNMMIYNTLDIMRVAPYLADYKFSRKNPLNYVRFPIQLGYDITRRVPPALLKGFVETGRQVTGAVEEKLFGRIAPSGEAPLISAAAPEQGERVMFNMLTGREKASPGQRVMRGAFSVGYLGARLLDLAGRNTTISAMDGLARRSGASPDEAMKFAKFISDQQYLVNSRLGLSPSMQGGISSLLWALKKVPMAIAEGTYEAASSLKQGYFGGPTVSREADPTAFLRGARVGGTLRGLESPPAGLTAEGGLMPDVPTPEPWWSPGEKEAYTKLQGQIAPFGRSYPLTDVQRNQAVWRGYAHGLTFAAIGYAALQMWGDFKGVWNAMPWSVSTGIPAANYIEELAKLGKLQVKKSFSKLSTWEERDYRRLKNTLPLMLATPTAIIPGFGATRAKKWRMTHRGELSQDPAWFFDWRHPDSLSSTVLGDMAKDLVLSSAPVMWARGDNFLTAEERVKRLKESMARPGGMNRYAMPSQTPQ